MDQHERIKKAMAINDLLGETPPTERDGISYPYNPETYSDDVAIIKIVLASRYPAIRFSVGDK